jgi:hypothetical protein
MKPKLTEKRITVRLSEDDIHTMRTLRGLLRRPWQTDVDIVRTALHEAERTLSAERASR